MKREGMPTQRLEEKRVEERVGEGERERKSAHTWERKREKVLWFLLLYVFSSTWACPMQIGLFVLLEVLTLVLFVLFLQAFPIFVF